MIKIKDYEIDTNIILAPLAGVADLSFRLMMREFGAKFAFFEMTDVNALIYEHPETMRLLRPHEDDSPIAPQLVGAIPDKMYKAAEKILEITEVPFLDINAGCPVRKVTKKGAGSALLKTPDVLAEMIRGLVKRFDFPITVKIRSGFSKIEYSSLRDIAKLCEDSGASAIFVHGRSQAAGYGGDVDLDAIKLVKKNVAIPVIGSGNVFCPQDAESMLQYCGCDGVLIARGSFGNPWIFTDTENYLKSGNLPKKRTLRELKDALKKQLIYIDKYNAFSTQGKLGYMRKISQWYVHDFSGARDMRNKITFVKTYDELLKVIDSIPNI